MRRASTAVIFVLVMLGGIYGGYTSFVILFGVITALSLWEFLTLTIDQGKRRDWIRRIIGTIFGLMPFLIASLAHLGIIQVTNEFIISISWLLFPIFSLAFIYELIAQSKRPFTNLAFIVLGMFYIGAPFALLDFIAFEGDEFHAGIVFGLLMMTWMNDTGAYLVGSRIGKTKLLPRISPNKTWEGSIGGIVVTLLTGVMFSYFFKEISLLDWLVLAVLIAIFGSIGDLIESMLKRSVGVKDSGSLLPGHGGVLDRFDAFIFHLPFTAGYLLMVNG